MTTCYEGNLVLYYLISVDEETANRAAKQVQVTYSDKKAPILSLDDGINKGSFLPDIYPLTKGDAQSKTQFNSYSHLLVADNT